MTKAQALQVPPGAVPTLDDGLGFVALADRMQHDPALGPDASTTNASRICEDTRAREARIESWLARKFHRHVGAVHWLS